MYMTVYDLTRTGPERIIFNASSPSGPGLSLEQGDSGGGSFEDLTWSHSWFGGVGLYSMGASVNVKAMSGGFAFGGITLGAGFAIDLGIDDSLAYEKSGESGVGTTTFRVKINGSAKAVVDNIQIGDQGAYSVVSVDINEIGTTLEASAANTGDPLDLMDEKSANSILEIPVSFTWGDMESLSIGLYVGAQIFDSSSFTFGSLSLEADADFANTLEWLGFGDFYNSAGELVEGVTVTSASGVNYMIPAPSTFTLFTMPAILVARRRRA
jgi:hypothetical protein